MATDTNAVVTVDTVTLFTAAHEVPKRLTNHKNLGRLDTQSRMSFQKGSI